MKRYLGDGVYVDFDGFALTLTAENGIKVTNIIVLEPDVYSALVQYVEHIPDLHVMGRLPAMPPTKGKRNE
jgi:hypothetical protein